MPKLFPVVVKKSQSVGNGSANASWTDTTQWADPMMMVTDVGGETVDFTETATHEILTDPETAQTSDVLLAAGQTALPETVGAGDSVAGTVLPASDTMQVSGTVAGTQSLPEVIQFDDSSHPLLLAPLAYTNEVLQLSSGAFTNPLSVDAMSPSGTPDSDSWGDAWTDASVGQTGVNHGSDVLLHVNGSVAATQIGWVEVDLTGFAGWQAAGNGTLSWWYSYSALSAATGMTLAYFTSASRPFVESTIKQSNQPANAVTTIGTWTANNGGTFQNWTETIGTVAINAMLGKWVCFKFTGGTAMTSAATIVSREATGSEYMVLSLNLTR